MQSPPSAHRYNYFFMIEIIRTVCSIIPAMHLRKTGISVPPYILILKEKNVEKNQKIAKSIKNPKMSKLRLKIWRNTDHFLHSVLLRKNL